MARLSYDHQNDARELLADLVKIKSVNESDEQADRDQAEKEIADFVEERLVKIGMEVERVPLAPGRDNLVAHWPDQKGDKSFALQAHMDTVSVANMSIDPFRGGIHDGKLWGRGACDTKGSLAAFLTALSVARKKSYRTLDKIWFVATAGEETGCKGATALVKSGFGVDGMVVGEPTRCRLVSAHKGTCWATLEARGQSCHASNPHLGNNAILVMSRALRHLEEVFLPSLQKQSHPLLGSPTCSVGMIAGGTAPNIVPASCRIALDFRVLPGDDPAGLASRLMEELDSLLPEEELKLTIDQVQGGVDVPAESNLVRSLLGPCRERAGQEEPEGVHYFADSGPFFEAGIPCILFGPGDIAQAHTADEFLELDQLVLASDIALTWLEKGTERSLV